MKGESMTAHSHAPALFRAGHEPRVSDLRSGRVRLAGNETQLSRCPAARASDRGPIPGRLVVTTQRLIHQPTWLRRKPFGHAGSWEASWLQIHSVCVEPVLVACRDGREEDGWVRVTVLARGQMALFVVPNAQELLDVVAELSGV